MNKLRGLALIAVVLMALLALSAFLPLGQLSGLTLPIGLAAFFLTQKAELACETPDALSLKALPGALKRRHAGLWLLAPMAMNALCNLIAKGLLPEFLEHLTARTAFLSLHQVPLLLFELALSALGEEIAWRAFFQKQLEKVVPPWAALSAASLLFAVCHYAPGNPVVVFYDLLFVFFNAMLYGMVFRKTDSALASALAHLLANLFGIASVLFL